MVAQTIHQRIIPLLLALLALVALAPAASAHAPATVTDPGDGAQPWWLQPEPATVAEDPALPVEPCVPAFCRVGGTQYGMATPVTVVASGGSVTWYSLDTAYHTATSSDFALNGRYGPPASDFTATFEIRADGLYVDDADGDGFELSTVAVGAADGGYVLPYECLFHGAQQTGVVHVVPAQ